MKKKIIRLLKGTAVTVLALITLFCLITFLYMMQTKFGKNPSGERLARMMKSPHFKDGKFQNLSPTPEITEGYGYTDVMYEFFFKRSPRRTPIDVIPSVKTDLLNLPPDQDVLVWFGHSSYFIQLDGKRILVDPVFSGNASPVPGTNKSFKGTDRYIVEDLPAIDYLFISHDHYDHADYETLIKLKSKVKTVICGLGVGAHFEDWGYPLNAISETDWNETLEPDPGFVVYTKPARHFSGRGLTKNNTLWQSYLLQTPTMKIYIGGDSGYDTHFADIGNQHGPIDLVLIDNGQYDIKWKYIHTLPEEVIQAAKDLKAKRLFPVHSSKFMMANHPWDEPLRRVAELSQDAQIPLVTPMIGELVYLNHMQQTFKRWWEGLN